MGPNLASSSVDYEQRIRQFYKVLAEVAVEKYGILIDFEKEEAYHYKWDLPSSKWLFEDFLAGEDIEALLSSVRERGYNILMNFYAPDVIHGNVVLKINDKWFAIGECINKEGKGDYPLDNIYIICIWPLKYVLSNINRVQVQLRHAVPLRYFLQTL